MDYHYRLNGDHYVLHDGEDAIGEPLDEVAIALDAESCTLHKHGDPAYVTKWIDKARKMFIQGGFPGMAKDLVMIQGRFTLEDLNRCLSTSGFAGQLYKRIQAESKAIDADAVEILDPVSPPSQTTAERQAPAGLMDDGDQDSLEVIETRFGSMRSRTTRR